MLLGEKVRLISWLATIGGFGGVLLIARPGGTLIGIGMSGLVVFSFSTLIGSAIGLPYLHPPLSTILMSAGASSLLSLLVGPIASVYSAIRLGRSDN